MSGLSACITTSTWTPGTKRVFCLWTAKGECCVSPSPWWAANVFSRVFAQRLSFLLYASRKRHNWLLMFLKPSGTPVGGDQILVYLYSSLDLFAGDFKTVTFRQDSHFTFYVTAPLNSAFLSRPRGCRGTLDLVTVVLPFYAHIFLWIPHSVCPSEMQLHLPNDPRMILCHMY